MTDITVHLSCLPNRRRPCVPDLKIGDIVTGYRGRRMRVLEVDEWVIVRDQATGPYCRLQALDDAQCIVIWPRAWYCKTGESMQLEFA